jgi:hypothetical protein
MHIDGYLSRSDATLHKQQSEYAHYERYVTLPKEWGSGRISDDVRNQSRDKNKGRYESETARAVSAFYGHEGDSGKQFHQQYRDEEIIEEPMTVNI